MNFLQNSILLDIELIAPDFFIYEVLNVAKFYHRNLEEILCLIEDYQNLNLKIINPDKNHIKTAIEISKIGNKKSGYPSIYDSLFHSIAIEENCLFLTTDNKHYQKTKHLKHIILLKDLPFKY